MATSTRQRTDGTKRSKPPAIKRMAQVESSPFYNIIVTGPPGTGKTPLVHSSNTMRTLCLEADRGVESALLAGTSADVWTIESLEDLEEAVEYFTHGSGCKDYDLVTWDTVSRTQERGLDGIMKELVATPGKEHRKLWLADKGEHYQNMNRLSFAARNLVDAPIHFIMVTWEMLYEDPESGETTIMPMIRGKDMSPKFCGYVGYVLRTEKRDEGEGEDCWLTTDSDDGRYYTKDRSGAVKSMQHPNIDQVFRRIERALSGLSTNRKRRSSAE